MDEKGFDGLNIVPMVDVMLVLLTIVLTTSTFIAGGLIPVDLPKAVHSKSENQKAMIIEIDPTGGIYFNAAPMSLQALQEKLQPVNRSIPVLIRADRTVPLQGFIDVLDTVKGSGFGKISIQTMAQ